MPHELEEHHTPEAIRERLSGGPDHSYLRDFIYGAIDGSVTTFAVVAGVSGAQLSAGVVIIMGMANLFADGFSMAASNYLGTRAEKQVRDQARATEQEHINRIPEGEREEIRQIFAAKGFTGRDLEQAVQIITSDHHQWVETMLREELGIAPEIRSARKAALFTFIAFVLFGLIPLLPYIYEMITKNKPPYVLPISVALTGIALFMIGALKSRFVQQTWMRAGLETLAVGGSAATLAYLVGVLLKGVGAGM